MTLFETVIALVLAFTWGTFFGVTMVRQKWLLVDRLRAGGEECGKP